MSLTGVPEPELRQLLVHLDKTLSLVDAFLVQATLMLEPAAGVVKDLHAVTSDVRERFGPK